MSLTRLDPYLLSIYNLTYKIYQLNSIKTLTMAYRKTVRILPNMQPHMFPNAPATRCGKPSESELGFCAIEARGRLHADGVSIVGTTLANPV